MTAKEYLSQGFYLDKEINEKILEIEKLISDCADALNYLRICPHRSTMTTAQNRKWQITLINITN